MLRLEVEGGYPRPTMTDPITATTSEPDSRERLFRTGLRWLLRCFLAPVRFRTSGCELIEELAQQHGGVILTIWHEVLLYISWSERRKGYATLVSQHQDGDRIASFLEHHSFALARGSSTRGGDAGARQLIRLLRQGRSGIITVDGPRGPHREVKPGAAAIARLTGQPLIPLAIAFRGSKQLGTWDRMHLPMPWGRALAVAGAPVMPAPAKAPREADEEITLQIGINLAEASTRAEEHFESLFRGGSKGLPEVPRIDDT